VATIARRNVPSSVLIHPSGKALVIAILEDLQHHPGGNPLTGAQISQKLCNELAAAKLRSPAQRLVLSSPNLFLPAMV
jgi:hypothetical protein